MAAEGAGDLIRVVALLGAAVIAVPLFKRISCWFSDWPIRFGISR